MSAAEYGVNRGHGVNAVADQQVSRRADRPVFGLSAIEDLLDPERTLVGSLLDPEGPPHRDVLAIPVDGVERPVQVQVHAGLREQGPGADIERLGQPTDGVDVEGVVVRIRTFSYGTDEGCPGVGVLEQFRLRLRSEDHDVIEFVSPRLVRDHGEGKAKEHRDRGSNSCGHAPRPLRQQVPPRGSLRVCTRIERGRSSTASETPCAVVIISAGRGYSERSALLPDGMFIEIFSPRSHRVDQPDSGRSGSSLGTMPRRRALPPTDRLPAGVPPTAPPVRAGIWDRILVVSLDGDVVSAAAHGVFQVGVIRVALTDVGPGQAALGGAAAGRAGRVDVLPFPKSLAAPIRPPAFDVLAGVIGPLELRPRPAC